MISKFIYQFLPMQKRVEKNAAVLKGIVGELSLIDQLKYHVTSLGWVSVYFHGAPILIFRVKNAGHDADIINNTDSQELAAQANIKFIIERYAKGGTIKITDRGFAKTKTQPSLTLIH